LKEVTFRCRAACDTASHSFSGGYLKTSFVFVDKKKKEMKKKKKREGKEGGEKKEGKR